MEEERAVPADLLGPVGFRDGRTVRSGVDRLVLGGKYLLGWHYCFYLWIDVVRCKRRWSEKGGGERGMGWGCGVRGYGREGQRLFMSSRSGGMSKRVGDAGLLPFAVRSIRGCRIWVRPLAPRRRLAARFAWEFGSVISAQSSRPDRELPHVLIHEACAHPSTPFRIPNSTPPRTGHPQPDPSDYDPHQTEDATLPVPTPEHTLNKRRWAPLTIVADRPETRRST